jgi:hypothetical protein
MNEQPLDYRGSRAERVAYAAPAGRMRARGNQQVELALVFRLSASAVL